MKQFRKVFAALLMILSIVLACIGVQAFADESEEEKYEPFFAEEDILDASCFSTASIGHRTFALIQPLCLQ